MSKSSKACLEPTHAEITACAQRIYEQEGRPEGRALEHWLQAEAQLVADRKAQAGALPGKAAPKAPTAMKPMPILSPASANAHGAGWQAQPSNRQPAHRN